MGSLVHDAKAAEYQEWLEEKNLDQNKSRVNQKRCLWR
jgi:hypothetical protein